MATRRGETFTADEANLDKLKEIRHLIQIGASPRATLSLSRAARAHALLENRTFVTPDDVKSVAPDILRHRLILTFEADARNVNTDDIVATLLDTVNVP
jgi:MoxR-like ATPase